MKKRVKKLIQGVMVFIKENVKYKFETSEEGVKKMEMKYVPKNGEAYETKLIEESKGDK